jgi:hypothetical protein
MIRNLFSADWLLARNDRGYGTLPIPQARDGEISNLIATWMNLDEPSRNESALQITDQQSTVFLTYSERMASLAVRERNQELLVFGLIALGLDGWRFDWRENIMILSLHYDAAERIGAKPELVFEKAAALLNKSVANALHSSVDPLLTSHWRQWATSQQLITRAFTIGGHGEIVAIEVGTTPRRDGPAPSRPLDLRFEFLQRIGRVDIDQRGPLDIARRALRRADQ